MKQMKIKVLFLLITALFISLNVSAQRNGARIGYIDTEYILQNIPEYQEATVQLNNKVQKWKTEIDQRLGQVAQKRKDLSNEKALLTKELIEEREEDIMFEEQEILDYQQKRFGPDGDLTIQKKSLIQPIQDQIFAAVQDIAEQRNYDFIFDKSADVVMLFSAERYDLSEQVIRIITRASKREQAKNKKERKEAEEEEIVPEVNKELEERQQELEERKAQRAAELEERRKAQQEAREAKKREMEERRQKLLEEREKARQEKIDARNKTKDSINANNSTANKTAEEGKSETETKAKTRAEELEEKRKQREKDKAERQKALEERRKKLEEEREKARKERENKQNEDKENEDTEEEDDSDEDN